MSFTKEAHWDKVEELKQTGTSTPILARDVSRLRQAHQAVLDAGAEAVQLRKKGDDPMFAPTPPLESLRTTLSLATTTIKGQLEHDYNPGSNNRTQIMFIDIARTLLC